jgi:O-antigen biosynthesis protein
MKIAYVLPMTWACGGISAPLFQVNALTARGHEVIVFAPEDGRIDWFPLAAPVQPHREHPVEDYFDAVVYVGDTFAGHSFSSARQEFLLLQGKDHLWTARAKRNQLLQGYSDPQYCILAVSGWLADFVREKCSNPRVSIIGNGVDINRFFPAPAPREKFRLLLEGNFPDRNKNVIAAIEIAGRVRQHFPVEIWAMARRFASAGSLVDRILLDPPSEEIPGIYQQCDALLKTSILEGFGLPHLEAMACGCIPITYASGGVLDFCKHGENSLIAGVGNLPSLLGHVLHFLSDSELRTRLKVGALATAQSNTWDRAADALEHAFAGGIEGKL